MDDALAPPESQWLVLPLPLGLPLAGGDGEDSDGELCWFMHWATAKPARQGGDVTKWEERSRPGRSGCVCPNCARGPVGRTPASKVGLGPACKSHANQPKPGSLKVWVGSAGS